MLRNRISRTNVIERIRRELEAQRFNFDGRTLCVTASFGMSGFQPDTAANFSHLPRADIALYAAKHADPNHIEVAEALKTERQ